MLSIPPHIRQRLRKEQLAESAVSSPEMCALLKNAGLRPTEQRLFLCDLLFQSGQHRHVTADALHKESKLKGAALSLATVYNTLNQFVSAGLLRRICITGERTYYDTDLNSHQHFYDEDEQTIFDIPPDVKWFDTLPEPPEGYDISTIDVVIRLTRN